MATNLYLRSSQGNAIGATYFDMLAAAGAGVATAVTTLTAGGSHIAMTQTEGGTGIVFISGRAPVGGFTLTSVTLSAWVEESNANDNATFEFTIHKRTAAGVESDIGTGYWSYGTEVTASPAEYVTSEFNIGDTEFLENDRILLKLFATNATAKTMTAGTFTLSYNAAGAATGDSFLTLAETVTFKAEDTALSVSKAETATISDIKTVWLDQLVGTKADTATIKDLLTVILDVLVASKVDTATISDTFSVVMPFVVGNSDTATLSDLITVILSCINVSKADSVSVADIASVWLDQFVISKADSSTISDFATILFDMINLVGSETGTVLDSQTVWFDKLVISKID